MKKTFLSLAISLLFAASILCADLPFSVLPWNGYKAAISLTFDDGDPVHLDLVIPEMQKRGMKGTFFLIADKIQREDEWKEAASGGMEIGNHSSLHKRASELSAEDEKYEVDAAGTYLKDKFSQPVVAYAYPFTEITPGLRARVEKNCIVARGGGWGTQFYVPGMEPDWYDIRCLASMTDLKFDAYKQWVDQALEMGAWTTCMIHAIEGSNWFQPVPKDIFLKFLDYLKEKEKDIWVAPFGEAGAYWKAQKAVESAKVTARDGVINIKWTVPPPFPKGVVLKVKVDGDKYMLSQSGAGIKPVSPGIYPVSFDSGGMVIEEAKKSGNKPGFYTAGRKIFAPGGEEVVLRGVNKMSVWTDKAGATLPEIARTGANCVRLVWTMNDGTLSELDALITRCVSERMIPLIELHDWTCKWEKAAFDGITGYWTSGAALEMIRKHEKYLMINYGNEIGTWQVTPEEYTSVYSAELKKMRKAGIHVPVIIDMPKCGQDINAYYACAEDIKRNDPDNNVVFSVHMWWTDNDPVRIKDALSSASYVDVPLIAGEFAAMGIGCAQSIAYKTIIEECARTNTGWLAWEWGPGNRDCALMDMTKDGKFDSLYGWGREAAIDDKFSIKNTAKIPEYMLQFKGKK